MAFEKDHYPDAIQREELAAKTSMDPKRIQVNNVKFDPNIDILSNRKGQCTEICRTLQKGLKFRI